MTITDEMVEAACRKYHDAWSSYPTKQFLRNEMRAALTAALAVEPETEVKPVCWMRMEAWGKEFYHYAIAGGTPCYAAPVAAPVQVKALEWEYREQPMLTYSATDDRGLLYYINQTFGSDSYYFATFRHSDGIIVYDGDDLQSAKAAAQADYEQRIRSALVAAPSRDDVVRECIAVVESLHRITSYGVYIDSREAVAALRALISGDTSK